jgi:hypothetical protein
MEPRGDCRFGLRFFPGFCPNWCVTGGAGFVGICQIVRGCNRDSLPRSRLLANIVESPVLGITSSWPIIHEQQSGSARSGMTCSTKPNARITTRRFTGSRTPTGRGVFTSSKKSPWIRTRRFCCWYTCGWKSCIRGCAEKTKYDRRHYSHSR